MLWIRWRQISWNWMTLRNSSTGQSSWTNISWNWWSRVKRVWQRNCSRFQRVNFLFCHSNCQRCSRMWWILSGLLMLVLQPLAVFSSLCQKRSRYFCQKSCKEPKKSKERRVDPDHKISYKTSSSSYLGKIVPGAINSQEWLSQTSLIPSNNIFWTILSNRRAREVKSILLLIGIYRYSAEALKTCWLISKLLLIIYISYSRIFPSILFIARHNLLSFVGIWWDPILLP